MRTLFVALILALIVYLTNGCASRHVEEPYDYPKWEYPKSWYNYPTTDEEMFEWIEIDGQAKKIVKPIKVK